MSRLLIINTSINTGSTGRIAECIGEKAESEGFAVTAAYGVANNNSKIDTIHIGSTADRYVHALATRLADRHGFSSRGVTKKFIEQLSHARPDIVNLHNIHGYYLNVEILFDYLAKEDIPVIWTFHDCWPFTGHCSYFDAVNCNRWESECFSCPNKHSYPTSKFIDNSPDNYRRKKELFNRVKNLTIIAPCQWMADNVKRSFLKNAAVKVIYNGVDTSVFKACDDNEKNNLKNRLGLAGKRVYLGVASVWDKRKGLDDFIKLSKMLGAEEHLVLIGLNEAQLKNLPDNITGIKRTESIAELTMFYSMADCFVNPTYVDNFPTTNIEALACGTPVVTYLTGGSPEAIDFQTGRVVEKGNLVDLLDKIREIIAMQVNDKCRERAVKFFNSDDRFAEYVKLFKEKCIITH